MTPLSSLNSVDRRRWLTFLPVLIVALLIAVTVLFLRGQTQIAVAKGIVQGLGEPLPISSSAHLIVTPWIFNWNDPFLQSQTFDVALHMGTLVALLGFFWRDWLTLVLHAHRPQTVAGRTFWMMVLASVPGAVFGYLLDSLAEGVFQQAYLVIALTLTVMGLLLYVADHFAPRSHTIEDVNWKMALLIGLSQAAALVPGVSRSGATMTMGRALKLEREAAARFSFILAVPITAGAGMLKLTELELTQLNSAFWLGIAVSTFVGALAIGFLLRYVRNRSFLPFVIYRVVLAVVILAVYLAR